MIKIDDVKKIAVIGSGAMGHGIAQVFALAGYSVSMTDVRQEFLDSAMKRISSSLEVMVGKGKITRDEMERVLKQNITATTDTAAAVNGAGLVVEAVPEVMELKKDIFRKLSGMASADALLVTNTSTMSITEISTAVTNPGRFAGMHFFNPVTAMKLVEVIYGRETSESAIDLICGISSKCGKVPVKVLKDSPGFIVNRINAPNQALLSAILDEGKIKPADIDSMMKKIGVKMAPFETADFVGLDVFTHTLEYYSETLSPQYRPGKYLSEKVSSNKLGMKTGEGIYSWSNGRAVIDSSGESREITALHFLSVQINEAVKVYREGIAGSTEDIDSAVKFGMNAFAGPFALAAGMQPAQISDALNYLAERYRLDILRPEPEILDGSFRSLGKQ